MRLIMLCTQTGSLNGRDLLTFTAGQEYDLPEHLPDGSPGLGTVFLREGWAQEVPPEPEPVTRPRGRGRRR